MTLEGLYAERDRLRGLHREASAAVEALREPIEANRIAINAELRSRGGDSGSPSPHERKRYVGQSPPHTSQCDPNKDPPERVRLEELPEFFSRLAE